MMDVEQTAHRLVREWYAARTPGTDLAARIAAALRAARAEALEEAISAIREEMASAREQLRQARIGLKRYGDHLPECSYVADRNAECTCGLWNLRGELRAATGGQSWEI